MAYSPRRRRSGNRNSRPTRARGGWPRKKARVTRRRSTSPSPRAQTLKIVIEQSQPTLAPTFLPGQVGQQVATLPRKARF